MVFGGVGSGSIFLHRTARGRRLLRLGRAGHRPGALYGGRIGVHVVRQGEGRRRGGIPPGRSRSGEQIRQIPVCRGRSGRGRLLREVIGGQEQLGHALVCLGGRGGAEQIGQGGIGLPGLGQGRAKVSHIVMAAQDLEHGLAQGIFRDGQGQGMAETGVGQRIPLALVGGQGHGAEGACPFGKAVITAQQRRGIHGSLGAADQQHGCRCPALAGPGSQTVGQGARLMAGAGQVAQHGTQLATGGGIRRADQDRGQVIVRSFRDLQLQGEDDGRAAGAALHAQEAAVGRRQFPDAGQELRGTLFRGQARARVAHLEEQMPGVFAVRHTAHGKMDLAALGGAHGIFQQQAEDVFQLPCGAFIALSEIGRDMPVQDCAGLFCQRTAGLMGLPQRPVQVEDTFRRTGRIRWGRSRRHGSIAGRVVQQAQGLPGAAAHVFHTGAGIVRQGASFELAVLFHDLAQGRGKGLFQAPDGRGGGAFGFHCGRCGSRLAEAGHERQGVAVGIQQTQVGIRDGLVLDRAARYQGIGGFGGVARFMAGSAHARDDQGAEGRPPQGQGALDEGREQRPEIEDGQTGAQRGHEAAQQETAGARHAHEPGAERGGHEDQGQHGPERQEAPHPAEVGPEGQQGQHGAGQGKQQVLDVQQAGMAGGLHQVPGQMGQEHEGQAGGHGTGGIGGRDVAGAQVRPAQYGMGQGGAHIQGRPEAPLAALSDAAQQGQQHDHGQGQHDAGAEQAFRRARQIVQAAQGGREPEGRLPVQADEADLRHFAGQGQGQQVAPVGLALLPGGLAGKRVHVGRIEDGSRRDALAKIEHQGLGTLRPGSGDLQTQPGHAAAAGQAPGMQRLERGQHARRGHFFHAHVAVRIQKSRKVGQDAQLSRCGALGRRGQAHGQGGRGRGDRGRRRDRQAGGGQGQDEQERDDDQGQPAGTGL